MYLVPEERRPAMLKRRSLGTDEAGVTNTLQAKSGSFEREQYLILFQYSMMSSSFSATFPAFTLST